MHLSTLALIGLPLLQTAFALKVPLDCQKKKTNLGDPGSTALYTRNDLIYIVNVTVGGHGYPVQLDTGSSDLWVLANPPVSDAKLTSIDVELRYGTGSARGVVGTAPVSFAGFDIPKQAFLNVSFSDNPVLVNDAVGILGVGFTSLSLIDQKVSATGADWGRSVLYNTFVQYPEEPNFIAFFLKRSPDPNVLVEGSFTIGEVEEGYEAVMKAKPVGTVPPSNPSRWTVLFDGYSVEDGPVKNVNSGVPKVPKDKSVVLLDSGTSLITAPAAVPKDIYGSIKGAKFDSKTGLWTVPCDTEIHLTFYIGGEKYPLHPLDVVLPNGDGTCIGSIQAEAGNPELDLIAGDAFLRSVYSLYDFGDFVDGTHKMGDPYVKMISILDPATASAEFKKERGGSGSSKPSGVGNVNVDTSPASASPTPSSTNSVTLSDLYNKLENGVKYLGFALGLLGLGALGLGCICGAAIVAILNRRKPRGTVLPTARSAPGVDPAAFTATPRGSYEPVSMYNEDTGKHDYDQPKYGY